MSSFRKRLMSTIQDEAVIKKVKKETEDNDKTLREIVWIENEEEWLEMSINYIG